MENPCSCLKRKTIELNFWSLFYQYWMIKIIKRTLKRKWCECSHFHRIKKKVTKLWDLGKVLGNVLWRPRGSFLCCCFFGFFVQLFGPFYPRVPFFNRSVHGQQRRAFLTQNYFLQEVLELNFSMSCIIGEIGNDLESDPQTLSTKVLMEILSREKNQGRTDRSTENFRRP